MGKWLDRARQQTTPRSRSTSLATKPLPPAEGLGWDSECWRAFFDERAGIAEYDGGEPRREAERQAFEHCVAHWLATNPPELVSGTACVHCDGEAQEGEAIALATDCEARIHSRCHPAFLAARRSAAVESLARLGIKRI